MTHEFKTVDIKGKAYVMVNERISYFWSMYPAPKGRIVTDVLSNDNGVCFIKASIFIDDILVATGHAQEKESGSFINKTSYIENCETSAVGRALGMLGIGIDTSIATAEEVQTAIANQSSGKPEIQEIEKDAKFDIKSEVLKIVSSTFKTKEDFELWKESKDITKSIKYMDEKELSSLLDLLVFDFEDKQ